MIKVEKYSKIYSGFKAVDNISFEAEKGKVLAIIGPNGAGKSTTLKAITGLIRPSRGRITIDGMTHGKNSTKIKQRIGYMPEESAVYEDMNVSDYLHFFAELYKVKKGAAEQRIKYLLESLKLKVDRKKVIGNMSKGMKRKVLIARSLINNPSILIYDEPASGLDPVTTNFILNYITELKKQGKLIIITAHNLHHLQMIADRVIIMKDGKIIEEGDLENVRDRYGKTFLITYKEKGKIKTSRFKDSAELNRFVKRIVSAGLEIMDVHSEQKSLEEIFIDLTEMR